MRIKSILLVSLCFISSVAFAEDRQAQQTIIFDAAKSGVQWHIIDSSATSDGTSYEFAPIGQSASNWRQMIRTMLLPYSSNSSITMRKLMQAQIDDANKSCRDVASHVLEQSSTTLAYTLNVDQCSNGERQMQIGKSFKGKEGIHNVMYSAVVGKVTQSEYQRALHLIESARLGSNPIAGSNVVY